MHLLYSRAVACARQAPHSGDGAPSEHATKFEEDQNIGQVSVHLTRNALRSFDILSSLRPIDVDLRRSSHDVNTKSFSDSTVL